MFWLYTSQNIECLAGAKVKRFLMQYQNTQLCGRLNKKTFNLVVSKIQTWTSLKFLVHIFLERTSKVISEPISKFETGDKLRANPFPVRSSVDKRSRHERPNLTLATSILFCICLYTFSKEASVIRPVKSEIKCYFFSF